MVKYRLQSLTSAIYFVSLCTYADETTIRQIEIECKQKAKYPESSLSAMFVGDAQRSVFERCQRELHRQYTIRAQDLLYLNDKQSDQKYRKVLSNSDTESNVEMSIISSKVVEGAAQNSKTQQGNKIRSTTFVLQR